MTSQNQDITGSQFENSQTQLTQAGRDAVSFLNSNDNRVTINNIVLRLFGQSTPPAVDWAWAHRLLEQKQLPEIRKRLTDTLGRDRSLMQISLDEQLSWVGRSPLQAERRLQVQDQDRGVLDMRQMLIETFGQDDIAGKLLILGTPGAGKTTALLSLAEQLVCGAIANPKTVIPVLFELSTWCNDSQSIEDWLIEQLYDLHGGDRKAKRYEHWLEQQVLLPVLDGLDELGLERQQKCTLKLNEFARQYPHMVVCCRVREFEQGNVKLNNLNGAVCLEPLSDGQIQAYLEMIQQPQFWSAIQSTPALQHLLEPDEEGNPGLLRVPLFITLAARVYDPQHPFQTKADLLEQYVDRQLSPEVRESDRRKDVERRKWENKTPALEPHWRQTQRTLRWLARQLQQNNTVELLIEYIQPDWLETKGARRRYWLIVGLIAGLFFGSSVIFINVFVMISAAISMMLLTNFFMSIENWFVGLNPNQYIWNSLHIFLITVALNYPLIAIAIVELYPYPLQDPLQVAVFFSFLLSFLCKHGQVCLEHVCLRFVLWQSGIAPWNLARFLNYCVERKLLQRVGGRYRFLHRELLDHFAGQSPTVRSGTGLVGR